MKAVKLSRYSFVVSRVALALPGGSLRQRYLGGAFWSVLGTGLSQTSTFVTALIAARLLGSNEFGEYGMVQSTAGMLGILAGMGLGLASTKYVSELRDRDPGASGRVVGLSTIVCAASAGIASACLFVYAPFLSAEVFKAPQLSLALRISAFTVLFNALSGVQLGTLMGLEDFRSTFYINASKAVLTALLATLGIWLWRLPGMLLGLAVVAGITCSLGWVIEKRTCIAHRIPIVYRGAFREAALLWRFAVPSVAATLIPGVVFWAVRTILVRAPSGYSQLGIFTAADQWTLALAFIAGNLNTAGLPILSNVYGRGNWELYKKALLANLLLPIGATAVCALGIGIAAPWLERIYGPSYVGLSPVLVLISIVSVMRVLGGTLGTFIASIGQMWWGLGFNLLWGTILVAAALLLMDRGALGLALAYLVAYTVHSVVGGTFLTARLRSARSVLATNSAVH